MAVPARFERAASAFGGQHSIQLSYGTFCIVRAIGVVQFPALVTHFPRASPVVAAWRW
jgi:hypothetical protein